MKVIASRPVLAAALVAGAGLLAVGNLALADGTESARNEPRSMTVRYGDLDLKNPAGVEVLYDRLRSAARRVCGTAGSRDLRDNVAVRQCYRDSLDRAVAQMDLAELAARHQGSVRRMAALAPRTTVSR